MARCSRLNMSSALSCIRVGSSGLPSFLFTPLDSLAIAALLSRSESSASSPAFLFSPLREGGTGVVEATSAEAFGNVPWRATALCAGAVLAYAMLFQWLGFALATALMALPVGMAFGGSWKQSLAGGTGLGLVLYLLFDKLLDVVLPTGPLAALLGGS